MDITIIPTNSIMSITTMMVPAAAIIMTESERANRNVGESIRSLAWLLRTHDSFYPTGGYAHSMGLEPLVQAGMVRDVPSFRQFLEQLAIPSLLKTEVPLYAAAWNALEHKSQDAVWPQLRELAHLHHASRSPLELKQAGLRTGKQRLSMTAQAVPDGLCARFLPLFEKEQVPTSICVAAALDARDGHVALLDGAVALVYTSLTGYVSAAGKLLRLGQRAMQQELLAALERCSDGINEAVTVPVENCGWTVPWWDMHCCKHESADHRLFLS